MAQLQQSGEGRVVLPPSVEPVKYRLSFTPDLASFLFQGSAEIDIQIVSETDTIQLHSKDLAISSVAVHRGPKGDGITPRFINFDLEMSVVSLVFPETLATGPAVLKINFQGEHNNQMAGFYRSGYTSIKGEKKVMVSTQFEPIDARRCFPCWDEPDRKAVFDVSFVIPENLNVIGNMPEAELKSLADGKKFVRFLETPKMSTYLLAFCVGEFDFVQARTQHGVLIRVFTPPGKTDQGLFALDVGVKSLDIYDDFFGVPYPLPKLDMIAIPEFAMGAMENWGLVTYREVDLLIDEATASSRQKQRVCTVVTHELAHQWFGNLVTMKWWDDLWLNEGFASWTQNYAADVIFPEWKMWEQFVTYELASALRLDSLRSSHPIQVPIRHAHEVEEVFDAISYSKGGSVVRMMYAVLGHDNFQKGLQIYMDEFKYGNTVTSDLWGAWSKASGLDIAGLARSWTEQMGYPVVSASVSGSDGSKLKIKLVQTYYLQDGSPLTEEEAKKLWSIPIFLASPATPSQLVMMNGKELEVEVDVKSADDWVKVNAGQNVPIRVVYSSDLLNRLGGAIARGELSVSDRAGLVGDANALIKSGELDVASLLRFLSAFSSEEDTTVWGAISGTLDQLDHIFSGDERLFQNFLPFAKKLVLPTALKVGWEAKETDGHAGLMLRGTLISLLGRYATDQPEVIEEAKRRFKAFLVDEDNAALPSEYKASVYRMVLKAGGEEEFQLVMRRATTAETTAERVLCYHSLGSTSSPKLKQQVLDFCMSDQIKLQDFFYPMGSVRTSDSLGRDIAFEFFKERFEDLKAKLAAASPSLMDAVIASCCAGFTTREKLDEVSKFFEDHPLPQSARRISQLKESLEINAKFFERVLALKELSDEEFWKSL